MIKLNAKQLRVSEGDDDIKKQLKKNHIYIICDNIIDTYNVGSMFRLADAVAVEKVLLCGITETPPNSRIKKASINTTEWVDWEYFASTMEAIKSLRAQVPNIQIISVEQDAKSVPYHIAKYKFPLAIMVHNETLGATQEVLHEADMIVEMPMFGVNTSLNVMVSLAIVTYQVIQKLP